MSTPLVTRRWSNTLWWVASAGALLSPLLLLSLSLLDVLVSLSDVYPSATFVLRDSLWPWLSSTFAAILGFGLAMGLSRILAGLLVRGFLYGRLEQAPLLRWALCLATVPSMVGVLSIAFLIQSFLVGHPESNPLENLRFRSLSVLLAAGFHVLRYVPIATWLFYIQLVGSSTGDRAYLAFHGADASHATAVEYWPRFRLFGLALSFLLFIDTFQEFIFLQLVLRPSVGTDTELIAHFFSRAYFELLSLSGVTMAVRALTLAGILTGGAALIVAVLLVALADRLTFRPVDKIRSSGVRLNNSPVTGVTLAAVVLLVFPATLGFLSLGLRPSLSSAPEGLLRTFCLCVCCAILSVAWAVVACVHVRLVSYRRNWQIERVLTLLAAVGLSFALLPWNAMALAMFRMTTMLPIRDELIPATWLLCQTLKVTPLIMVLVGTTVLSISDAEVSFQDVAGVSPWGFLCNSAFRPFRTAYLAYGIFAFILVWNESSVASAFQNGVTSFSEVALIAMNGRGASFPIASALAAIALSLGVGLSVLWGLAVATSGKRGGFGTAL